MVTLNVLLLYQFSYLFAQNRWWGYVLMVKQWGNKMQQAMVVSLSWICLGFVLAERVCFVDASAACVFLGTVTISLKVCNSGV